MSPMAGWCMLSVVFESKKRFGRVGVGTAIHEVRETLYENHSRHNFCCVRAGCFLTGTDNGAAGFRACEEPGFDRAADDPAKPAEKHPWRHRSHARGQVQL